METSEFLETCLKLELERRGETAGLDDAPVAEAGLRGDVVESRLLICRGDHPLAEEAMIELRAAVAALLGESLRRSLAPGDAVACAIMGEGIFRGSTGGLSMITVLHSSMERRNIA